MDVHCHVEWVVYFVLFPVEAPSVFGVAKVNNELLGFGRVVFADPTACPAIIGSLEVMGDAVVSAVDVDWVDPWFCAVVRSREFDYKTCKLGLTSGNGDLRVGVWCRRGIWFVGTGCGGGEFDGSIGATAGGGGDAAVGGEFLAGDAGHFDVGEFGARDGGAAVTGVFEVEIDGGVGGVAGGTDAGFVGASLVRVAGAGHGEVEGLGIDGLSF